MVQYCPRRSYPPFHQSTPFQKFSSISHFPNTQHSTQFSTAEWIVSNLAQTTLHTQSTIIKHYRDARKPVEPDFKLLAAMTEREKERLRAHRSLCGVLREFSTLLTGGPRWLVNEQNKRGFGRAARATDRAFTRRTWTRVYRSVFGLYGSRLYRSKVRSSVFGGELTAKSLLSCNLLVARYVHRCTGVGYRSRCPDFLHVHWRLGCEQCIVWYSAGSVRSVLWPFCYAQDICVILLVPSGWFFLVPTGIRGSPAFLR